MSGETTIRTERKEKSLMELHIAAETQQSSKPFLYPTNVLAGHTLYLYFIKPRPSWNHNSCQLGPSVLQQNSFWIYDGCNKVIEAEQPNNAGELSKTL